MCTVAYIPLKNKLLFASLRDENPLREKALRPRLQRTGSAPFLAPLDPSGGGSWVGINRRGCVVILLNGGFRKHARKEHYRKSRGQIVTEMLMDETPLVMWGLLDLRQIEPFTLIVWHCGKLFQLVWNGKKKSRIALPQNRPLLWSSVTLYKSESRKKRSGLFSHWASKELKASPENLFSFFQSVDDPRNGFLVNREEKIKTLSFTTLELSGSGKAGIRYQDLTDGTIQLQTFFTLISPSSSNCCPLS